MSLADDQRLTRLAAQQTAINYAGRLVRSNHSGSFGVVVGWTDDGLLIIERRDDRGGWGINGTDPNHHYTAPVVHGLQQYCCIYGDVELLEEPAP